MRRSGRKKRALRSNQETDEGKLRRPGELLDKENPIQGGNTRQRSRPGDNVGTITQTIWMSLVEHDTFVNWVKTTLNNGTARFTTNVWLGSSYVNKVCQFIQPGTKLT